MAEQAETGASSPETDTALRNVGEQVRWLSTAIVDAANRGRTSSGLKVGGHQASSASMVEIMTALWFGELTALDRVSVKPHASPVLHAINYLLGDLDAQYLPTLRSLGGMQSYPSRTKDHDAVDFSTGSVGIGATAPIWAALSHRYLRQHFPSTPPAGRFISLLGDAELDEGAIWEAVADPTVAELGEILWVVDVNRQSLDRVVPRLQVHRLQGMFEAAGWQVLTLKWGGSLQRVFDQTGGQALRSRLEEMPNEEYQRMLRVPPCDVRSRLLGDRADTQLEKVLSGLDDATLTSLVRDLGGHDIGLLRSAYKQADASRPTVIFAYTIKGRGLPTEGHPNNHSTLLTGPQMEALAAATGMSLADPWRRFATDSAEEELCRQVAKLLARPETSTVPLPDPPTSLPWRYGASVSTQAALGRFLSDLARSAPEVAERVVTCSPDVASSTNLGGWINRTGIWSTGERHDWFEDDAERVLRWTEGSAGQHIEIGIAEVNLVSLASELGTTWSRWGQPLIPIATLYDPFLGRALEPWSYGIYAGGQSILVGTPSGVSLAPEGAAHQSIITPSIGIEQPGCVAWEPAFAKDLEWCLLAAMASLGKPGGTSAYFRLSTRPVRQALAALPENEALLERRRQYAVAGGYRLTDNRPGSEDVTLVGVGAVMTEVLEAADHLKELGLRPGVVCLTSPDRVYRSLHSRQSPGSGGGAIADLLFPPQLAAPLVTVLDGHPHTLSFLSAIRGDRSVSLGVTRFGQSSDLSDAYKLHGLDADAIVAAALTLLGR